MSERLDKNNGKNYFSEVKFNRLNFDFLQLNVKIVKIWTLDKTAVCPET